MVFSVYMAKVIGIATIGTCIGLLVGCGGTHAFAVFSIGRMPVIPVPGLYLEPLIVAGVFGLLVAVLLPFGPLPRSGSASVSSVPGRRRTS